MAVTRERLLELLDAEEPDYSAAALEAGLDSFDVLSGMVQEVDAWVAARAASLAARLAADPASVDGVVPVLTQAYGHVDAGVRAAAALGAGRAGKDGNEVLKKALHDTDSGVRMVAMRGAVPPLEPDVAAAINIAAVGDVAQAVKEVAQAIAARIPNQDLANELIATVLDYIQARVSELRALALGNLASFAAAMEKPGFVDVGGAVAIRLTAARAALDLIPPSMAASDFKGAVHQIGKALGEISAATANVGGLTFEDFLTRRISWTAAVPSGLAKQLGLSASPPALKVDGDTLVHTLEAPARELMHAPVLKFDRLDQPALARD